jgi:glycosyltransferase involved in cell wall biosynthesis
MPGFTIDPQPYYASAHLFVLSSNYEGFGNVIVEALNAGVPVVSTACPSGPREILGNGRYGKLVPCGDAGALSEAMDQALTTAFNPDLLRTRAKAMSGAKSLERYSELMLPRQNPD